MEKSSRTSSLRGAVTTAAAAPAQAAQAPAPAAKDLRGALLSRPQRSVISEAKALELLRQLVGFCNGVVAPRPARDTASVVDGNGVQGKPKTPFERVKDFSNTCAVEKIFGTTCGELPAVPKSLVGENKDDTKHEIAHDYFGTMVLPKEVRDEGWIAKFVAGDGNCAWRALAMGIWGSDVYWAPLKLAVLAWTAANAEELVSEGGILWNCTRYYPQAVMKYARFSSEGDVLSTRQGNIKMVIASVALFGEPKRWGGDLTMLMASQALRLRVKMLVPIDRKSRKQYDAQGAAPFHGTGRKGTNTVDDYRHSRDFLPDEAQLVYRVAGADGGERLIEEVAVVLTHGCQIARQKDLSDIPEVGKDTTLEAGCHFGTFAKRDGTFPPFPVVAVSPPLFQVQDAEDEEDEEEARIRALVFGKGESSLLSSFGAESFGAEAKAGVGGATGAESGFYEDFGGDVDDVDDGTGAAVIGGKGEGGEGAPAWVDDDDAHLKVDIAAKNRLRKLRETREERELTGPEFEQRLRSRFASSNMKADWVKAAENKNKAKASKGKKREQGGDSSDDDVDSEAGEEEQEDALLRDSSSLMGGKGGVLEPGYLNIVRCKDANQHDPAKAVVRAVSFHPTGELLLTGGFDKTLRLFQVDGVRNTKMHSIFFDDLPITNATFTSSDQAVITGRRPFFYSYDVATGKVQKVPRIFSSGRVEKHMETFAASPDGRWLAFVGSEGYVLLLSSKTKQWAADFKLNSSATAVTFTPDSGYILAAGGDGDVYKFDVRSRRCVLRFFNEGGTATTSLATTSSSSSLGLTAVSSDSGVVNVYDADTLETGKRVLRPSPLKAVMSLTTPVTTTKFSPDGQMLAVASNQKRDALKVIHSASCTPFTNWPTERTPVRYPFALDFSPGGGFLAVGNDRGCVLLYRIRHYPQT